MCIRTPTLLFVVLILIQFYPTPARPQGKELRDGAPEENALRPPADATITPHDFTNARPPEPAGMSAIRKTALAHAQAFMEATQDATNAADPLYSLTYHLPKLIADPLPLQDDRNLTMPSWLSLGPEWTADQLDFFSSRPNLRVYSQEPLKQETEADWFMRPLVDGPFELDQDGSLRNRYLTLDIDMIRWCLYCTQLSVAHSGWDRLPTRGVDSVP